MTDPAAPSSRATDTRLVHEGRDPGANHGIVNPPVYHASTVLFPTLAALQERPVFGKTSYGRRGTPTTFALQEAVSALEGGGRAVLAPSGLAAVTMALLSFAGAGDEVLVTDSVYGPTRHFCDTMLKRLGVTTRYYAPGIGAGIEQMIGPRTRVIFLESPGSQTLEVEDVPAITAVARKRGVGTIMDNTWATPLFCKPLDLGVDISVQAATKYIAGHADVMMGIATACAGAWTAMSRGHAALGLCAGPDDVYLALRGLRTLAVRLRRHMDAGLDMARWLADRPDVLRVIHPALPGDPGHGLWRRDFTGASGLFSVELPPCTPEALAAMLDHMELFAMGYSWGGYESLIVPVWPRRTAAPWRGEGQLLRLHVGLEDTGDLKDDLDRGLARLAAA